MRTIRNILTIISLSLILPVVASAQSLSDVQAMSKEDRRNYIESMSDDERSAMRDRWRAEFEQLPEEQKAAIREQRQAKGGGGNRGRDREAMRQRWESMSEEDRAAAKEKFRAKEEKRRANFEAMSEEERAAYRAKRGEHKGQRQGGQHKGNAGDGKVESDPEN